MGRFIGLWRRRPFRSAACKPLQTFDRAVLIQPVRRVALLGQARQLEDAHALGPALKGRGDLFCMLPARIVIVRQDHDMRTVKVGRALRPPLARAPGIAGRGQAEPGEPVGILFALGHDDLSAGRDSLPHLGQPINERWSALRVPDPAALAIGLTLPELLPRLALDAESELAAGIKVVIALAALLRPEPPLAQRADDLLLAAASVTVHNDTTRVSGRYRQAGIRVVMGRTAGSAVAGVVVPLTPQCLGERLRVRYTAGRIRIFHWVQRLVDR